MLRASLLALRKNPRRNRLRFYCMVTAYNFRRRRPVEKGNLLKHQPGCQTGDICPAGSANWAKFHSYAGRSTAMVGGSAPKPLDLRSLNMPLMMAWTLLIKICCCLSGLETTAGQCRLVADARVVPQFAQLSRNHAVETQRLLGLFA